MTTLRARRLLYFLAIPVVWFGTIALGSGYVAVRSLGARTFPWNNGATIENTIFHFDLPRLLQDHVYARDLQWLDYSAFLLHASWFFLPIAFGIVVTVFERRRMMEYFSWLLVASYVACVMFVLLPVTPPWMEPGTARILAARSFVQYTTVDDNPVAAFPSLHAGLPMVIALFFFLRCERTRVVGWLALAFAGAISLAVIYLGEHWLVDVLAGWGLAASVAALFTNPRVHEVYARIPGDPVAKIRAFDRLLNEFPAPELPTPPLDLPEEEAEAA